MATHTTEYQGHTIQILQDSGGYYARIDGHDEPLEYAESAEQALEHARQLVERGWF